MAYGASLFVGLFVVWVAATFGDGWPPATMLGYGAGAATLGTFFAWRCGAFRREGALADAPVRALRALLQLPASMMSAFRVVAAAFGLGKRAPGLLRLTLAPASADRLDRVVEALSASPDLVAIDADGGSVLMHAFAEERATLDRAKACERAIGGGRAP